MVYRRAAIRMHVYVFSISFIFSFKNKDKSPFNFVHSLPYLICLVIISGSSKSMHSYILEDSHPCFLGHSRVLCYTGNSPTKQTAWCYLKCSTRRKNMCEITGFCPNTNWAAPKKTEIQGRDFPNVLLSPQRVHVSASLGLSHWWPLKYSSWLKNHSLIALYKAW